MDHRGFKSDRVTIDDGMRQHQGTSVVVQVPRDSANTTKNGFKAWIDHMEYTRLSSLNYHVCYIYIAFT